MATIKQRLLKKNSSGTYDTVHLETSADLITGILAASNGGTGVDSIEKLRTLLNIPSISGKLEVISASVYKHTYSFTPIIVFASWQCGSSIMYNGETVYYEMLRLSGRTLSTNATTTLIYHSIAIGL